MQLPSIFRKYYSNAFVAVLIDSTECAYVCQIYKNGKKIEESSNSYEMNPNGEIPKQFVQFLKQIQKKYPFTYVSYMMNSLGQGAIRGCENKDFTKYNIDVKNINYICLDKKWSVYSSFIEVNYLKKIFEPTGIDYIFSPFVFLNNLYKKESLQDKKTILYALNCSESLTMIVMKNGEFAFGAHFKTTEEEKFYESGETSWENAEKEKGVEGMVSMSKIEEADDFGDIINLDDLDAHDEDSDLLGRVFDDDEGESAEVLPSSTLEVFGRDLIVFKYIQSSIEEFYSNAIYESDFIEKLVIYDAFGISPEILDFIRNELFIDVEVKEVNIFEQINFLAIAESGYEI